MEALLGGPRRQNDARELPLRGTHHKQQVSLLGARRHAGRWARALSLDHDQRRLRHPRQSQGLYHQREAAARGRRHGPHAGVVGPDGHADGGDLVLGVLGDEPVTSSVGRHPLDDGGGRRHRVGRHEATATQESSQAESVIAVDHHPRWGLDRLHLVLEIGRVALAGEIVGPSGDFQVGIHHALAFLGEVVANHAGHALETVFSHTGSSPQSGGVGHNLGATLCSECRKWYREQPDPPSLQTLFIHSDPFVVDESTSGHDLALVSLDGLGNEGQQ